MNEIVPIAGGLLLGAVLGIVPRWRLAIGALGAVLIGVLATVVSGEYRVSWEFLLFDIPLAAVCTVAAYLGVRQLSARAATKPQSRDT